MGMLVRVQERRVTRHEVKRGDRGSQSNETSDLLTSNGRRVLCDGCRAAPLPAVGLGRFSRLCPAARAAGFAQGCRA